MCRESHYEHGINDKVKWMKIMIKTTDTALGVYIISPIQAFSYMFIHLMWRKYKNLLYQLFPVKINKPKEEDLKSLHLKFIACYVSKVATEDAGLPPFPLHLLGKHS